MIPLRLEKKKAPKYRAIRVMVDGERFDSKRESIRWQVLRMLESSGDIKDLKRQVRYPLFVFPMAGSYTIGQPATRIGSYVSDFDYFDCATETSISEDIKGVLTPMFKWKAKHFEAQYGRKIRVTK